MNYKNQLNYYYGQEADVFYISKGAPSKKDISDEIGDGVVARIDPKSKEVRGLTIINFAKRSKKASKTTKLPFEVSFIQQ